MLRMPDVAADAIDLTSLPAEAAALIKRLQQRAVTDAQELGRRDREIALARVKIDKLNFVTLPRFHVQQEVDNFRGTENRNERRQAAQEAVHTGVQG